MRSALAGLAMPVLIDYIVANYPLDNLTVVSPDAGRVRLADAYTDRLGAPLEVVAAATSRNFEHLFLLPAPAGE